MKNAPNAPTIGKKTLALTVGEVMDGPLFVRVAPQLVFRPDKLMCDGTEHQLPRDDQAARAPGEIIQIKLPKEATRSSRVFVTGDALMDEPVRQLLDGQIGGEEVPKENRVEPRSAILLTRAPQFHGRITALRVSALAPCGVCLGSGFVGSVDKVQCPTCKVIDQRHHCKDVTLDALKIGSRDQLMVMRGGIPIDDIDQLLNLLPLRTDPFCPGQFVSATLFNRSPYPVDLFVEADCEVLDMGEPPHLSGKYPSVNLPR